MKFAAEREYRKLLANTLEHGTHIQGRNGGTLSLNNTTLKIDCRGGRLPLFLSKKVAYKAVIHELIWFLKGDTSLKYMHANNVHIWDLWADEEGELGPIYGHQWSRQLEGILKKAVSDPYSRRLLVNSWQLDDLDKMNLVPCHFSYQLLNYPAQRYISISGKDVKLDSTSRIKQTDIVVTMRSSDAFLGMPFNMLSYSILLHLICSKIGTLPGYVYINSGNFHIYDSHIAAVKQQLKNKPVYRTSKEATLSGDFYGKSFNLLEISDFTINNYKPQFGTIKAPLSA